MYYQKHLYIFFLILALSLSFFSTSKAKEFFIDQIKIQEKLENNFNKEKLINKGFIKAFEELMSKLVQSKNIAKIQNIKLNEIKSMIETFTIKEEKFINKTYNLNMGVSFNKKKVFEYLEQKNIFPTQIKEENFLLIPIFLDQENNDILDEFEVSAEAAENKTQVKIRGKDGAVLFALDIYCGVICFNKEYAGTRVTHCEVIFD